jgi:protein subunit release factor A
VSRDVALLSNVVVAVVVDGEVCLAKRERQKKKKKKKKKKGKREKGKGTECDRASRFRCRRTQILFPKARVTPHRQRVGLAVLKSTKLTSNLFAFVAL